MSTEDGLETIRAVASIFRNKEGRDFPVYITDTMIRIGYTDGIVYNTESESDIKILERHGLVRNEEYKVWVLPK